MANLLWQYEDGPNVWKNYSSEHMTALNAAIAADSSACNLKLPNSFEVTVDFDKGIQSRKGASASASRKMRVVFVLKPVDAKGSELAALWQADLKPWANMPPGPACKLEAAHNRGDSTISVSIGGNAYTVDLRRLTQTNDKTGFRRNIRRRVLPERDWKAAAAAAAVPDPRPAVTRRTSGRLAAAGRKRPAASPSPPPSSANGDESEDKVADAEQDKKSSGNKKQPAKKQKKGSTEAATASDQDNLDEEKPDEKVVIVRGAAAVDTELTGLSAASVRVYTDGGAVYDAMLNQTNLQFNNNKFYLLQLLQKPPHHYWVWFRWGRVGKAGQRSLVPCGHDLDRAKALFCKKFEDKTKNEWASVAAKTFRKVPGKYDLVHRDHKAAVADNENASSTVATKAKKSSTAAAAEVASRLHAAVQALISLVCDVQQMQDTVVEMRYDAKRLPLGKLTPAQIRAGFAALKAVEALVRGGQTAGQKLVQACNDFYTRIPHDFGMRVPPVIRSLEEVQAKADLLQALEQIQTALKVVSDGSDAESAEHPLDRCYRRLACDIQPVDATSDEFALIDRYLQNTHGPTHNLYKLSLLTLFKVQRTAETDRFRSDLPNRMLLWHGSRLSNWAGILSQGLRVAPPEAPVTGYMFGKGVYFADVSSKSANYLYATRSKPSGILALCEVALGTSRELGKADYQAAKLPADCHSVKGVGELMPDPAALVVLPDGCRVPAGKLVPSNQQTVLNYNEFVVYSVDQLRLRYLVQVRFNFK